MFFHPKNLKSAMKIITHDLIFYCTQSIVCAIVDSQCLAYLGYITLSEKKNIFKQIYWLRTTDYQFRHFVNEECQKRVDIEAMIKI